MVLTAALLLCPSAAIALLIDRGGGLIYSDLLDVTFLADANHAETSGYDVDGLMTRLEAVQWVDQLVYQGYDDWRLPVADWPGAITFSGYIREGEMGQLFYEELDGSRMRSIHDIHNASFDLFSNVQTKKYWTSTLTGSQQQFGWYFDFANGYQGETPTHALYYAWAVRDGDSTPIPEPTAVLLLATGLAALVWRVRRG